MSDAIIVMQKSDAINIVKGWHRVEVLRAKINAYAWCIKLGSPFLVNFFIPNEEDYEDVPISVFADGKWESSTIVSDQNIIYFFRYARDAVEFKLMIYTEVDKILDNLHIVRMNDADAIGEAMYWAKTNFGRIIFPDDYIIMGSHGLFLEEFSRRGTINSGAIWDFIVDEDRVKVGFVFKDAKTAVEFKLRFG